MVYVCNVGEQDAASGNDFTQAIKAKVKEIKAINNKWCEFYTTG